MKYSTYNIYDNIIIIAKHYLLPGGMGTAIFDLHANIAVCYEP